MKRQLATAVLAIGLLVLIAGPSHAVYEVVSADSVTLSSSGDTGTISYAQPINGYTVSVEGGDVHVAHQAVDAVQEDLLLKSTDPPFKSRLYEDFSELDFVADSKNASAVTVHVRGVRLN